MLPKMRELIAALERAGFVHRDQDEREVFDELCQVVEEAIALFRSDGKPLPPANSGRDLARRILDAA